MLRTLIKRLMGLNPPPADTGLIAVPANIPVPQPANDPTPVHVPLMTLRDILRHNRNDTLVQPGSTVVTKNGAEMKVARGVTQKPPYVVCVYRGRRLSVRPDSIDCRWDQVSDLIQ
jgi:hypothetical protein